MIKTENKQRTTTATTTIEIQTAIRTLLSEGQKKKIKNAIDSKIILLYCGAAVFLYDIWILF